MSLYLKYRPSTFEDVKGNNEIVETLTGMLAKSREDFPHAILFHGETGCGKTTLARIIANELGSSGTDLVEMDSATFRGIDTIRDIRRSAQFMPLEGACRVWIVDEVHKWTNDAQNAMLKILEDTPKHVYFILCTTDPQKLLAAIKNRCSQFQVKPLNEIQMKALLRQVVREEGQTLDKASYEKIVEVSNGHPRHALQVLNQILALPEDKRAEAIQNFSDEQAEVKQLCQALLKGESWKMISTLLKGLKDQEPESIRRSVIGYCNVVLLNNENLQAGLIMEEFLHPFFDFGHAQLTYACYSVFVKTKGE